MEYTIVAYRQYGKWSCTMPFERRADAERHVADRLTTRKITLPDGKEFVTHNADHVKDITYLQVKLPE